MSFLGSRFGHLSNASFAARANISRAYNPSSLPNFDKPAETIDARGLPFKYEPSKIMVELGDYRKADYPYKLNNLFVYFAFFLSL